MKTFNDRARGRFPFEVVIPLVESCFREFKERFSEDAMPSSDWTTDREGTWTVSITPESGGWRFFFLSECDAVEAKLRFG